MMFKIDKKKLANTLPISLTKNFPVHDSFALHTSNYSMEKMTLTTRTTLSKIFKIESVRLKRATKGFKSKICLSFQTFWAFPLRIF